jgi:hypothetical protein
VDRSDGSKVRDKYMVMSAYKRCPLDIK